MALISDAMMVLFYDIDGNTADHDDWHSYEHFHERLSVPGFQRATRWVAADAGTAPRYLVTYEVSGVDVATSEAYLARLNGPTGWTREMMPRFRGMVRGFAQVGAGAGFGLGNAAVALRLAPETGAEARLRAWLAGELAAMASRRGMTGAHLLVPAPPPPMTREQALRGTDKVMPWLVLATGYDAAALERATAAHLDTDALRRGGVAGDIILGRYALDYTASAQEVARTATPRVLAPETRTSDGPRN
jgi:hypothetical protein